MGKRWGERGGGEANDTAVRDDSEKALRTLIIPPPRVHTHPHTHTHTQPHIHTYTHTHNYTFNTFNYTDEHTLMARWMTPSPWRYLGGRREGGGGGDI